MILGLKEFNTEEKLTRILQKKIFIMKGIASTEGR